MKNYKIIIGIDVSKSKLDVWLMQNPKDTEQKHFIVTNNEKGIKEMIKAVKARFQLTDCLFCFENTGIYSMPLSYYLSKISADYWIENALAIKRSKGISRGKNDKTDAKDIASYAFTHLHKLKLNTLPQKEIAQLKLLFAEREKLVKILRIMASTKEVENFIPKEISKEVIKTNAKTIAFLKIQFKEVEAKIQDVVKTNEKISQQINLVKSVPGIGSQTGLYLVMITKCFESFDNWRQLACYSGIAPFEYSSGSSIRGKTRVSHLADKKLKSILQMCVLTAIKTDSELKTYYHKKKSEGKNPMLVMNNIRCKLIARAFAVINRGTPFVNMKKFAA